MARISSNYALSRPRSQNAGINGPFDFFDDILSYGTDVYKTKLELDKAIAEGASAAQIAQLQQQLMAQQQEQRYADQMETRRFMVFGLTAGLGLVAFLAWNSNRNRPARRRRRRR